MQGTESPHTYGPGADTGSKGPLQWPEGARPRRPRSTAEPPAGPATVISYRFPSLKNESDLRRQYIFFFKKERKQTIKGKKERRRERKSALTRRWTVKSLLPGSSWLEVKHSWGAGDTSTARGPQTHKHFWLKERHLTAHHLFMDFERQTTKKQTWASIKSWLHFGKYGEKHENTNQ